MFPVSNAINAAVHGRLIYIDGKRVSINTLLMLPASTYFLKLSEDTRQLNLQTVTDGLHTDTDSAGRAKDAPGSL